MITIKFKRRALGGASGAPSSLKTSEPAYNETDDTLYIGVGDNGSGVATSVIPLAGAGTFVNRTSDQSVSGVKTFASSPVLPTPTAGDNSTKAATTAFVTTHVFDNAAPKESPTFTGTPTAPTAPVNTNTTQVATTAFVLAQAASTNPQPLGSAAVGTSTTFARADHVHAVPTLSELGAPTADVDYNGKKITGLADPVNAQDAATKNYVDAAAQGLDPKAPAKVATTANIASLSGLLTVDGVVLLTGDRVLVKDQTDASQNGIYVADSGAWSRSTDFDLWTEVDRAFVLIEQGTVNVGAGYFCTAATTGTMDTTPITWVQFSSANQISVGSGLTKTGNVISVQADTGIASTSSGVALTGQALELHNLATNGLITRTASGTVTSRTLTAGSSKVSVSNGDGVAGNPSIDVTESNLSLNNLGGTLTVAKGGTGATTLTGYVKADGENAMTASATIPSTDITGLGTMSTQAANNVNITGGTIDNISLDGGTF